MGGVLDLNTPNMGCASVAFLTGVHPEGEGRRQSSRSTLTKVLKVDMVTGTLTPY